MKKKKIRILTVKGQGKFTAGPKAPSDIIEILQAEYDAKSVLLIQGNNIISKILYRLKIFNTILISNLKNEVLLMQFPMYETTNILNKFFMFSLKFINKEKTIVLIHDLDSIRSEDKILKGQEIARLSKIKYIISHNEKMTEYLKSVLSEDKVIINIEIFDYLCDRQRKYEKKNRIEKEKFYVAYAGNLNKIKSPFLYQLDESKLNFRINLYGVGISNDINKKICYRSKFSPNELPDNIEADLGLIWDGNFDESDENKRYKNYTRYNNPHKLSCYVAAGIPVVCWEKAAIADFIKKYNIGYTINNIYDINNLDFSDYEEKQRNINKIQKNVRNGYYTKKAINKILKEIK